MKMLKILTTIITCFALTLLPCTGALTLNDTTTNIVAYYPWSLWQPSANGSMVNPTIVPNMGSMRSYMISAGQTYKQGWCWEHGDKFGSKTNFLFIGSLVVINTCILPYVVWNFIATTKDGRDTIYSGGYASVNATANKVTYFTNIFHVSPADAGNIAQYTFYYGTQSQPMPTNIWFIQYQIIAY